MAKGDGSDDQVPFEGANTLRQVRTSPDNHDVQWASRPWSRNRTIAKSGKETKGGRTASDVDSSRAVTLHKNLLLLGHILGQITARLTRNGNFGRRSNLVVGH
ncbi:hypothetical protein CIHG_04741 [Coccidioides immitis H538.4]|uniref:Uncharacterized protein n=3 Tax=Coccidioides immitis TaxID=5501 RepID=A0A0J8QM31_COCIT|nr:hypothetical protein CIRG_08162 [Coccidioides immitis RMSCC 2394]KMU72263.1 hypothetical protein CISG_02912 [Coccidioides immitis RMSCC 3703]KMU87296.1 hypothetical protein CIHG_04741 [Coccidioides immitis H538.4]